MRLLSVLIIAMAVFTAGAASAQEIERREVGNLVMENVPTIPDELQERLQQYQATRSASFADWVPGSDNMLITTRFGETSQVHRVDAPMADRSQLTFYREPVGGAGFSRHFFPNQFLMTMDAGGSERSQIYLHDMQTGKARLLSDGKSVNQDARWANTKPWIAFSSTRRNGRDFDIYFQDVNDPVTSPTLALQVDGSWSTMDWSPDDTQILLSREVSVTESHLYRMDVTTRELEEVNPTETPVAYGTARFRKDGLGLFFTSDQDSEYKRLYYHDLNHKASQVLVGDLKWDISTFVQSEDGKMLAISVNAGGLSQVFLLTLSTMERTPIELPPCTVSSLKFHPNGDKLAMTIGQATAPGDVYVYTLATKKLDRWTRSETGGIPESQFSPAQVFDYPTFDKDDSSKPRRIPAVLIKPSGTGPFPVVVRIHGGPEGQARPSFNGIDQFLVTELGIAVIHPNVRGSTGYGKSYSMLDNGMKREDSVKDIGALLDWIGRQPELDASRVVVTGGSYGGYMVLACMAAYSDRLCGGIDSVGISNFVTFLGTTSDYRKDLRRVEYGDEREPSMKDFLEAISPTTNAHKITKPLFVSQGLNDPRVPYTEAEQIVKVVRENSVPVWYMLANDEGHGFRKKVNNDAFTAASVLFLQQCLLKGKPVEQPVTRPIPTTTATPAASPGILLGS